MHGKRPVGSPAGIQRDPPKIRLDSSDSDLKTKPIYDSKCPKIEVPGLQESQYCNNIYEDFSLDPEDEYLDEPSDEISHVRDSQPRLIFVDVQVRGIKIRALIDCGASCSFISHEASLLLQAHQVPVRATRPSKVTTATGEVSELRETAFLPLEWGEKIAELKAKVLRSLGYSLVLGLDALRLYGVMLDFAAGQYLFASDPTTRHTFEEVPVSPVVESTLNSLLDQGIRELTSEQKARLEEFIKEKVPPLPEK